MGKKEKKTKTKVDPSDVKQNLSEAEIADLKHAFDLCDKDGNGEIDRHELAALFKKLGQNPSKKELKAMIDEVDVDGNGTVDFDEFLVLMQASKDHTEEDMRATFEVFDADGDGFITADEIKAAMDRLYGEKLSDKEVAQMIKEADQNDDQKIDFEEFKKMMSAK